MSLLFRAGLLCIAVAASGCGRADGGATLFTTSDSAGVRVVETMGLDAADSTDWAVDTTAMVSIGEFDADDPYVFGDLAGITRDVQGRIVVADKQASEIRFFDAQGKFLHKVGRTGEGPGEYYYLMQLMRRQPDSLAVLDYEGLRINILAGDGRYRRSYRPHKQANTGPRVTGMWADGSLLAIERLGACSRYRRLLEESKDQGVCVDSARFQRRAENGEVIRVLGPMVARREHLIPLEGNSMAMLSNRYPQAYWAAHGDRLYYSDAERFEVRVYTSDGRLERIMRVRYDPPAPTSETFSAPSMLLANMNQPADARARMERFLKATEAVPPPARVPAHTGMVVDRQGNVWLQEFESPIRRPSHAQRWFVFDTAGVLRHSLRIPAILAQERFTNWTGEIGDDYVLGYWRDADQVETVRFFPLRKRSPAN
jgi:hypothetical protein